MTLCMAVACEHEDEPRIVLCSDWKEEAEGIGSSENTDKQTWIADGWSVLTAGMSSQIEDVVRLYRQHLAKTVLDENNYMDELRIPAKQYKGALAEDFIQHMLAIPYAYFLQYGKERFPDDMFRDRLADVAKIKIQAQLIVTGFLLGNAVGGIKKGTFPVICVVEDNDAHTEVVREEIHFASIGSGTYIANAALYNRGAYSEMPAMAAVYAVFEAHRLSEKVPGVGESLTIDIMEPSGELRTLSDDGYAYCEFLWKKFGPKEVRTQHKGLFELKDSYFDPAPTQ